MPKLLISHCKTQIRLYSKESWELQDRPSIYFIKDTLRIVSWLFIKVWFNLILYRLLIWYGWSSSKLQHGWCQSYKSVFIQQAVIVYTGNGIHWHVEARTKVKYTEQNIQMITLVDQQDVFCILGKFFVELFGEQTLSTTVSRLLVSFYKALIYYIHFIPICHMWQNANYFSVLLNE